MKIVFFLFFATVMKIDYRKAYTLVLIYDNCLIKFIQIESINALIDSQVIYGV
jgi:hypothetical protein